MLKAEEGRIQMDLIEWGGIEGASLEVLAGRGGYRGMDGMERGKGSNTGGILGEEGVGG